METTRNYGISDTALLEFTGKMLAYLPEDLASFTAFDPDLNSELQDGLTHLYQRALDYGTDSAERGVVQKNTEDVQLQLKLCVSAYHEVRYFASKCFGSSPAILREFGVIKFRKVRGNQAQMIVFMFELAHAANKYKKELLDSGLSERTITALPELARNLEKVNVQQELSKNQRSLKTEVRVVMLNDIYAVLLKFYKASKIAFASNPIQRERYTLPIGRSTKKAVVTEPADS